MYRYSATAHRVPVLDVEVARGAGLWAGLRRAALAAHPAPAWQVDGTLDGDNLHNREHCLINIHFIIILNSRWEL